MTIDLKGVLKLTNLPFTLMLMFLIQMYHLIFGNYWESGCKLQSVTNKMLSDLHGVERNNYYSWVISQDRGHSFALQN